MVERFLFDGVNGQRAGSPIDFADEHAVVIAATATETRPAVGNMAMVRTEIALNYTVVQLLIIPTLHISEPRIARIILI